MRTWFSSWRLTVFDLSRQIGPDRPWRWRWIQIEREHESSSAFVFSLFCRMSNICCSWFFFSTPALLNLIDVFISLQRRPIRDVFFCLDSKTGRDREKEAIARGLFFPPLPPLRMIQNKVFMFIIWSDALCSESEFYASLFSFSNIQDVPSLMYLPAGNRSSRWQ